MTNILKDFFTKPLQGSTFKRMQSIILNMPNTDKSSTKHRSVLENEKNNYRKVSRNQNTALMNTRTLKTRATSQNNGSKTINHHCNGVHYGHRTFIIPQYSYFGFARSSLKSLFVVLETAITAKQWTLPLFIDYRDEFL